MHGQHDCQQYASHDRALHTQGTVCGMQTQCKGYGPGPTRKTPPGAMAGARLRRYSMNVDLGTPSSTTLAWCATIRLYCLSFCAHTAPSARHVSEMCEAVHSSEPGLVPRIGKTARAATPPSSKHCVVSYIAACQRLVERPAAQTGRRGWQQLCAGMR